MRKILFVRLATGATVALTAGFLLVWFALRPWYTRWGATDFEVRRVLPGDELLPVVHPLSERTKAVTINAPPERVWPWLLQLGQGRGGFYSYEWFENLIGMEIYNADKLVPAWQNLQVGDPVRMGPDGKAPPPYIVAQIVPGRALVLGHRNQQGGWHDTYSFVLEPAGSGATRLIHRSRAESLFVFDRALEPGYFLMERAMLLGIQLRAERSTGAAALHEGAP